MGKVISIFTKKEQQKQQQQTELDEYVTKFLKTLTDDQLATFTAILKLCAASEQAATIAEKARCIRRVLEQGSEVSGIQRTTPWDNAICAAVRAINSDEQFVTKGETE